jgi:hypothetical protein
MTTAHEQRLKQILKRLGQANFMLAHRFVVSPFSSGENRIKLPMKTQPSGDMDDG